MATTIDGAVVAEPAEATVASVSLHVARAMSAAVVVAPVMNNTTLSATPAPNYFVTNWKMVFGSRS